MNVIGCCLRNTNCSQNLRRLIGIGIHAAADQHLDLLIREQRFKHLGKFRVLAELRGQIFLVDDRPRWRVLLPLVMLEDRRVGATNRVRLRRAELSQSDLAAELRQHGEAVLYRRHPWPATPRLFGAAALAARAAGRLVRGIILRLGNCDLVHD
jgi:hypothetical protein